MDCIVASAHSVTTIPPRQKPRPKVAGREGLNMSTGSPTACERFLEKIDLFMQLDVATEFDPADIHWWLSLSGGKDSFAMAEGLREWYSRNGISFSASAFTIDQWGGPSHSAIVDQLPWVSVNVVDGRSRTLAATKYQAGNQAPCRTCADVRREVSDHVIEASGRRGIQMLARGLHLSDLAVSLAWRFALGREPAQDMIASGKGRPISKLGTSTYLAKPLTYAREFEAQEFARSRGFRPACCGCPACKFPSRRDIVEETLLGFYVGPLWEFQVPGLDALLTHFGATRTRDLSVPGVQEKHAHLPPDFAEFVVERFRLAAMRLPPDSTNAFDRGMDLDKVGDGRLRYQADLLDVASVPLPALLVGRPLTELEKRMVATLGPFWGALGLSSAFARQAEDLQRKYFNFTTDIHWSQVAGLLRDYYSKQRRRHHSPRLSIVQGDDA